MATSDDDLDIGKIPIIDLRCLCQDEIRQVAQLSGDFLHDIVTVAIDKSMFNESAGSRRQTYARDRISRRLRNPPVSDAPSKPRLSSGCIAKDKRPYKGNQDLIMRICGHLERHHAERFLWKDKSLLEQSTSSLEAMTVRGRPHAKDHAGLSVKQAKSQQSKDGCIRIERACKTKEAAGAARRGAEVALAGFPTRLGFSGDSGIQNFLRLDGQEWPSYKEVMRCAGSTIGQNASTEMRSGLSQDILHPTDMESSGLMTEVSKSLKSINETSFCSMNKRAALCAMCGKTFANQFSLKRHLGRIRHGADQARRAAVETRTYGKVKLTGYSRRHNHNMDQETGTDAEVKAGGMQRKVTASSVQGTSECKNCETLSTSKRKYLTHVSVILTKRSHRGKVRGHDCGQCDTRFDRSKPYAGHSNMHSRKSKEKVGRPTGKVRGRPVSRTLKSNRPGQSLDPFVQNNTLTEVKFDLERELESKPSESKLVYNTFNAVFGDHVACIHKQAVSPKKGNKRRREQHHFGRQVRFCEVGIGALENVENDTRFTCKECGKIFDEYSGYCSVHSKTRRKYASGIIHSTFSQSKDLVSGSAVNSENYKQNAIYSAMSSTTVVWRLLADVTGTYLSGLPAKLLFAEELNTFDSQKGKVAMFN